MDIQALIKNLHPLEVKVLLAYTAKDELTASRLEKDLGYKEGHANQAFSWLTGKELAEIAGVNLEEYGLEMLKAGTALGGKSESELLNMDMKIFEIDGKRIGVGQVNTVNEEEILERKEKLISEMNTLNSKENLDFFLFVITNILSNDSIGIVAGNGNEIIEKAFNGKVESNTVLLKGVVSRKKQVIPPLTRAIQGN